MLVDSHALLIVVVALVLDALIGDPDWLWKRLAHPVVLIGTMIGWLDRTLDVLGPGTTFRAVTVGGTTPACSAVAAALYATAIDTVEVPGSVFGSKAPSVEATMMYGMVRTLSIEPATGSPVNRVEQRTQYLSYQGKDVPAFEGTVSYTPATITDVVDQLKTQAPLLNAARLALPIGFGLGGLVLLSGGIVLARRRRDVEQGVTERELVEV